MIRPLGEGPLGRLARLARGRALEGGLAAAYAAFGLTFRGPQRAFWNRMTATGLVLGGLALLSEEDLRAIRLTPQDVALGLASAGVLYGVFVAGDRLARAILPRGGQEIASIYDLRTLGRKVELGARLALIIGPAEELFWRGLVQKRLIARYGRLAGALLGTAAYGGAHLVSGNLTLIGAASVAGAFWGGLHALGAPLSALIVSHAVWDVLVFLVAPIAPPAGE
ncbi:MAG TPA: CPBP family intramembrane glutamic endopeptidase [Roseiflexaceae bacterium]|nr:CPBP family intramembrane glutamic endopeptidase [Roseiflexaceae bacterium]